jgi:hypothetical protein
LTLFRFTDVSLEEEVEGDLELLVIVVPPELSNSARTSAR